MRPPSNWKDVPVPELMSRLKRDPRGFPIPYIVFTDKDQQSHFKVNAPDKEKKCVRENRCSICGNILNKNKWVVGGPLSAFHPEGAFNDVPMHGECLEYALRVCPYMAYTQYRSTGITNGLATMAAENKLGLVDVSQDQERLPLFVMCKIKSYRYVLKEIGKGLVMPSKPYLEIRYWNDGVELDTTQAKQIMDEYFKKRNVVLELPQH